MSDSTNVELHHSVDRLVLSGKRVYGWGWVAHRAGAVKNVHLNLQGEGWARRLPAGVGLSRRDVEEAHPALVNAGASGFVVTGYIPGFPARRLWLEVELDDGGKTDIDVTHVAENHYAQRNKRRLVAWLARSVWRRLKRGDLLGILRRAKAQTYAVPSLDDMSIVGELLPALKRCRDVCVMFDHNMGGGANHYRRAVIAERLSAGQAVLLCTYNLPILEYRLHLFQPGEDERVYRIFTFLVLERIIEDAPVVELFVNSPVSFDEPLVLAEWLAKMRAEHPKVRLTVTAHDYFSVCPSFVLLNAEGRYCGIPEISECSACLKRHQASYVALSPPTEIGPWRALWGRCLQAADEVRCFSDSTRAHLLRAYPALDTRRINVVPHKMDYAPLRLPRVDRKAPLVIGIMGEISLQKGALVVNEMLERIDRDHPEVRVVVLGTLDVAHRSERLQVTGPYQRRDLVDLVESHGINMFLFPSIWPETFSYVVGEMILLGLPIVAFDIGAPVERLRSYGNARLCGERSARTALATLIDFHRQLAMEEASAA